MSFLNKIPHKYKLWRYPIVLKLRYKMVSIFNPHTLRIKYWVNSRIFCWTPMIRPYNWGDYINPILAHLLTGRDIIPYTFNQGPSVAMVGSILPWAMDKNTIVWGSGCLDSRSEDWNHIEKPRQVCAVRGPLTRNVLLQHDIECPEIYGDPALLFPFYYQPTILKKKYKYGVIFHVSSLESAKMWLANNCNEDVLWINPAFFKSWKSFINEICSCDAILSSSLHGIIIADAYRIPNVWVTLTNKEHPDNNFKFKDYFLSVNKSIEKPINIDIFDETIISEHIKTWTVPQIDLQQLLAACPFLESQTINK